MTLDLRSRSFQDAGFMLVLGALCIYGLHNSFAGATYLIVGVIGLVFGIGLALLVQRLEQPLIVLALLTAAAFFLLGGAVALNGLGGTAMFPVPQTLSDLATAAVQGWKDMLTTLPPVSNGTLLALPYLLGLIAGALGMRVADKSGWVPAPTVVLGGLLAVVILMGVQHPSHPELYGALLAGGALAWMMIRAQRGRPDYVSGGSLRISRWLAGVLLCGGATVFAGLLGTSLPGYGATRTVLRSSVVPPFNVGQYPSPLAAFRRFTHGYTELQPSNGLYNTPLLKVTGLPSGSLIRFATLDSYDGTVWGAGDVAGSATASGPSDSDTFQKVGQVIDNPEHGKHVTATVKILNGALSVWVPTAGGLTGITFTKPNEEAASQSFRYNLATSTGVMPGSLQAGDSYTFSAVLPNDGLTSSTQLATGGLPEVSAYPEFEQVAARWAGHASAGIGQIDAIAAYLRANGHYTDGESGFQSFAAGHSLYRLNEFISTAGELAGDDEQYAALMALMANELGVPARVVLGAEVPANGVVTGSDVHAWVELQAADGSWKTLPQTAFMGTQPPKKQSQKSQPSVPTSVIPPPAPVTPPATAGQSLTNTVFHRQQGSKVRHPLPRAVSYALLYVGSPLLAIALFCALIIAFKIGRRARRRRHGSPARRLMFAWWELLDHARDFGHSVPVAATRREQAIALGFPGATAGAARLDAVMFGPEYPDEQSVAAYWSQTDKLRSEFAGGHNLWRRMRAALNLTTLKPRRMPKP